MPAPLARTASRRGVLAGAAALLAALALAPAGPARAADAALEAAADATLARLKASQPVTADMIARASGVLVFPEITKAGMAIVGGASGRGVLRTGGRTEGTYRSVAVSYGLQFGVGTYGYVMVLMDDASLAYVRDTAGWEIGVGPNVTVADEGVAGRLSSSTAQDGVYVFFVDQKGFFAGAGIEGAKISRIGD